MITRIQKWGNSLGVRIPKSVAEDADVKPGATVDLAVEGGRLVITPVRTRKHYDLASFGQITSKNRHADVDFGRPLGKEVWVVPRSYVPDQGDIVWLEFSPQAGHEQAGRRPALVVSPRSYNEKAKLGLFCPITNQVKGYPFEVILPPGFNVTGAVLADQVKSLDWRVRKAKRIAVAPQEVIEEALAKIATLIQSEQ